MRLKPGSPVWLHRRTKIHISQEAGQSRYERMAMRIEHQFAVRTCVEELTQLVETAERMSDVELLGPSRCHGWTAGDVLVHVHLGLPDMLLGCCMRCDS
jgi:hypothetical protein